MGIDRKALQSISVMKAEIRAYLLEKLNWTKYYKFNYGASSTPSAKHSGIDRQTLQSISKITDPAIRTYLLKKLNWQNYFDHNYV